MPLPSPPRQDAADTALERRVLAVLIVVGETLGEKQGDCDGKRVEREDPSSHDINTQLGRKQQLARPRMAAKTQKEGL